MGIFSQWQPRYAEHGIATFPVENKKPSVRGYLTLGLRRSGDLVKKFPQADSLGFVCGPRNGITVLDVDTAVEEVLADAIDRYGPTPFIVRSGSGHFHAYYRHNGERRCIRPNPAHPIDILGSGYSVAPPSLGPRERYAIVQGRLDDLVQLPCLRAPKLLTSAGTGPERGPAVGERNKVLWRLCMTQAPHCYDVDQLLDWARHRNLSFQTPLPEAEVVKSAASAWGYEERGQNWLARGRVVGVDHALIDGLMQQNPDAFVLLMKLRRVHWGRDFVLANATAALMPRGGWPRKRFSAARRHLEDCELIVLVRKATRQSPPIYRLARGGRK